MKKKINTPRLHALESRRKPLKHVNRSRLHHDVHPKMPFHGAQHAHSLGGDEKRHVARAARAGLGVPRSVINHAEERIVHNSDALEAVGMV